MKDQPNAPAGDYACDFEGCHKRFITAKGRNAHQKTHQQNSSQPPTKFLFNHKSFPSSPLDYVSTGVPGTLPFIVILIQILKRASVDISPSPPEVAGDDPPPLPEFFSTLIENVKKHGTLPLSYFVVDRG